MYIQKDIPTLYHIHTYVCIYVFPKITDNPFCSTAKRLSIGKRKTFLFANVCLVCVYGEADAYSSVARSYMNIIIIRHTGVYGVNPLLFKYIYML